MNGFCVFTIVFKSINISNIAQLLPGTGGTREIQRTMLELLNQLDGFDERGDVKVSEY